ncbi:MAG: nuclear transport factor 2 family protein [Acidimicrobiales bacterium]|nr:nuclear transport factor 2 family protein [Acidimicrobiales bacterium]
MDEQLIERNLATVRRICEHWHELTQDEFRELCAADLDYRNIPIEGDQHTGPDAAHAVLARFGERWNVRLQVNNIVGDERVVLTERTEFFEHRGGTKAPFALPVMGTFELVDGKVTAWRDYFELSHLKLR